MTKSKSTVSHKQLLVLNIFCITNAESISTVKNGRQKWEPFQK